jgi:putative RNA 2'-phosphotransferase
MGMRKDPKQLGKLMAYVLGHRPDEFGLVPDEEGFVRLKDLVKALSEEPGWGYVRKSHIHEVLITCGEDAFVTADDRIKAARPQASVGPVPGAVPPKLLYCCVRHKAYPVVCEKGLSPMGRRQVFLATTEDMALRMGKRRDSKPVLVTVQAQRASEAGMAFSMQGELIYMVDHVPVGYFSGPPLPKEKRKPTEPKKEAPLTRQALPGSFTLDMERAHELQRQGLKRKGVRKEIAWKKDARKMRRKHR